MQNSERLCQQLLAAEKQSAQADTAIRRIENQILALNAQLDQAKKGRDRANELVNQRTGELRTHLQAVAEGKVQDTDQADLHPVPVAEEIAPAQTLQPSAERETAPRRRRGRGGDDSGLDLS